VEYPKNNSNYNYKENFYYEEDFEEELARKPLNGAFLACIYSIPGSILWIILAYYTPFASLMGAFIMLGAMLGFKKGAKYMNPKIKTSLLIFSSLLMFVLTTGITSYTLYKQYNQDVIKQATIDELRESFITDLNNNGKSTEETNEMLMNKYGINGLSDIDGLNNFVKKTLADSYKDSHRVKNVPDTPTGSVLCLFQSLAYNRTIAKPYFMNILCGVVIAILTASGLLKLKYFKK